MIVITIASLKGGCGKTTAALFLAEALAFSGKSVVLIDADPNNNATDYLARDVSSEELEARSLHAALLGQRKLEECRFPTMFNLDVIPGTPSLAKVTMELAADPGIALRFPRAVRSLAADVVILDSPPALTLELNLALFAADVVIVPVGLSRWTVAAYRVVADLAARAEEVTTRQTRLLALPSIVTEKEADMIRKVADWNATETAIFKAAAVRNAANNHI